MSMAQDVLIKKSVQKIISTNTSVIGRSKSSNKLLLVSTYAYENQAGHISFLITCSFSNLPNMFEAEIVDLNSSLKSWFVFITPWSNW